MYHHFPKAILVFLAAAAAGGSGARAVAAGGRSVSLTQYPVVMRLGSDEFRIAFGIDARKCGAHGCNGVIRYRVDWQTEDGTARSEIKRVNYRAVPHAQRTIAVDRARFDTAEGEHTTAVVGVRVEQITCHEESPADL